MVCGKLVLIAVKLIMYEGYLPTLRVGGGDAVLYVAQEGDGLQ